MKKIFTLFFILIVFLFVVACKVDADGSTDKAKKSTPVKTTKTIFLIGGYDNTSTGSIPQSDVYKSTDALTWTKVDQKGLPNIYSHKAVVFRGKMYVIGGNVGNTKARALPSKDVYSSSDGVNWKKETITGELSKSWGHDAVVYKKKIYVIGGYNISGYINNVVISNDGISWKKSNFSLPNVSGVAPGRIYSVSFVVNNILHIAGGYNNVPNKNSNQVISLKADETGFDSPVVSGSSFELAASAVATLGDKTYLIGGSNGTPKSSVGLLGADKKWTNVSQTASFTPVSRHEAIVFNDKIYLLGGQTSTAKATNKIYSSSDAKSWKEETTAKGFPTIANAEVVIFDVPDTE